MDDVRLLGPADLAGVVPAGNWNNVDGITGNQAGLLADTGAVTVAAVNWAADTQWSAHNTPAGSNANAILTNGYIDDTNDAGADATDTSITLTGMAGTFVGPYDVYVYFGSDGNNRTLSGTIGGQTYYGETNTATAFDGTFTRADSTSPPPNQTLDSEYFLFQGVTGDSFTLTVDRISNNVGIHGVQIVGTLVPEPTGVGLLGVAAAGLLARRRRRQ